MRFGIFSLFLLFLSACASSGNLRHIAGYYEQENVKTVLSQWGKPSKIVTLDGGMSEYQYIDDLGFTHRYNVKTHEMDSIPNGCMTVFTVDADNIVTKWREKGMNCKSAP